MTLIIFGLLLEAFICWLVYQYMYSINTMIYSNPEEHMRATEIVLMTIYLVLSVATVMLAIVFDLQL